MSVQALVLNAESKTASVQSIANPEPGPGETVVKVHAIALNPVDALYTFKPLGSSGRVVGSDFAGIVEAVSAGSRLKSGTRVAGFLQGACSVNDRPGAFATYLTCPEDLVWQVPDSISLEAAATVSLCGLTAAQAIYYRIGLTAPFNLESNDEGKLPNPSTTYFFIYGASTSVGMYAAQLVRRSSEASGRSIKLIGAASRAQHEMLLAEPYGYHALVDYHDDDWPDQVQRLTGENRVMGALDCISEGPTVRQVSSNLIEGGKVAVLRSKAYGAWDPTGLPEGVDPIYGAVWEGLGEEIQYSSMVVPASPAARSFAVSFYKWLSTGPRLEPSPVRLMPGGLDQVVTDGFALLGSGSMNNRESNRTEPWMKAIRAEKLVYKIGS